MAILKTEAVVLNRFDYSNTSLIVTLYSRLFGRVSAIAKGARRPKSPFLGTLDLVNHNEIVYYTTRSSLYILSGSKVLNGFPHIREEVYRTYAATYLADLVREMTREEEHQPEVFDSLIGALRGLDAGWEPERTVMQFEIKFLKQIGYQPELEQCVECAGPCKGRAVYFNVTGGGVVCDRCTSGPRGEELLRVSRGAISTLQLLGRKTFHEGQNIRVSAPLSRELRRVLRPYVVARLEKEPRSLRYFLQARPD